MSLSSSESLNPRLKRALSCLDINLEAELVRYRKKRAGQSVSPVILPPKPKQKAPALGAPDLPAFGNPPPGTASNPPKILASDESSDLVPISVEPTEEPIQPAFERESEMAESDTPPHDYLESSEELLRSLAREEAQVKVERSFLESLATPLGVGSMMVLLLSSAMFGYVIMNPAILGGFGGLFARQEEATQAPAEAAGTAEVSYPPIASQEFADLSLNNLTTLPTRPAAKVPTAPIQPSASPSPSPVATGSSALVIPPVNVPATTPAQAPTPRDSYTPSAVSPSYSSGGSSSGRSSSGSSASSYSLSPIQNYSPPVQSAAAAVAPTSMNRTPGNRTPDGGYSYKVEIPYTGDQSLAAVQKVVPDAYLRPDGKIQMGAVGSEAEAKARAQQLKQQGIEAEVNRR